MVFLLESLFSFIIARAPALVKGSTRARTKKARGESLFLKAHLLAESRNEKPYASAA